MQTPRFPQPQVLSPMFTSGNSKDKVICLLLRVICLLLIVICLLLRVICLLLRVICLLLRCIMSLHICLTPVRGGLSLIRKSFLKKNIDQSRRLCIQDVWKYVILGTNGVAMARHGLILSHNEATGSRKVSRYLPDLRDAIKISKMFTKSKNPKIP